MPDTLLRDATVCSIVVSDGSEGLYLEVVGERFDHTGALAVYEVLWAAPDARMPDEVTLDLMAVNHVEWAAVALVTAVACRLSLSGHRLVLRLGHPQPRELFGAAARCGAIGVSDVPDDPQDQQPHLPVTELWLG